MAKAAEGRNEAQDDPVVHAVHAALRPKPAERAAAAAAGGEVSAFPETLEDAIKGARGGVRLPYSLARLLPACPAPLA
jgi:hypothetical protein